MANRVAVPRTLVGQIDAAQREERRLRRGLLLHRAGKVGFVLTPIAAYFFLWAPIVLLMVFSFNASSDVNVWGGFTTQWYENIINGTMGNEARFSTELMLKSVKNSLVVGLIATAVSTILGTTVALSLARGRFPGKKLIGGLLLLPILIPEITQGVSLAIFFSIVFDFMETMTGQRTVSGFGTIIVGHVVFNVSYVAIVVAARLANMNPRLEEAANDLGANGWHTFWHITFPLILPGMIAGALLAFTLSLDDFVVTFFNSGVGTTTLPVFVHSLLKVAVSPEINAISTLMLIVSTILIGFSLMMQGRAISRG
jgi:spermidine/putrescine transport system permease protein